MDRTGIIVISLCVALFGFWLFEQHKYADQLQAYMATHPTASAQSSLTASNTVTQTAPPVSSPIVVTPPVFDTNAPEQTLVLSNRLARYTFTSRGGGIKLVELVNYPDTISARWKTKGNNGSNG